MKMQSAFIILPDELASLEFFDGTWQVVGYCGEGVGGSVLGRGVTQRQALTAALKEVRALAKALEKKRKHLGRRN